VRSSVRVRRALRLAISLPVIIIDLTDGIKKKAGQD